ncbi:hypothetical protein [Demequina litorisediminis]|uniref:hypothetical protein n=1 Tax=Demequina litorisediminis TaxID=1849022 RepID=UPI003D66B61B
MAGHDLVAAAARLALDHAHRMADADGGLVAVIAPPALARDIAREVGSGVEGLSVMTARQSKGLEFDVAIVVDPAAIGERPGDLYVALTRPTRRLDIVHAGPLPAGLEHLRSV